MFVTALSGCSQISSGPEENELTDSSTALGNLSAQVDGLLEQHNRTPSIETASQLMGLYSLRHTFLSRSDDLHALYKLGAIQGEQGTRLRIRANMAVHRFDAVENDLENLSNPNSATQALELALGRTSPGMIAEARTSRVQDYPSFENLADLAIAQAINGDFEQADQTLEEARIAYVGISPFPHAWVEFQRGLMWCEMADQCTRAFVHYENAVALVPEYVVASVHLAELESLTHPQRALERLESFGKETDPEVLALRGELENNMTTRVELFTLANSMYESRLRDFPLAYADHAAQFYSSVGEDPHLAIDLAWQNLSNRRDDRAILLALEVAEATQDQALRCYAEERLATRLFAPTNVLLRNIIGSSQCS